MKISLSWLKEYLDLNVSATQIAKMLTAAGIEVDGLLSPPLGFERVVVARVVAVEPHPQADRLCVAEVTDGTATYQVVCGAPNCRPGIKTAYAQVGASLSDEKGIFPIKKMKLRGVDSAGMLCSEKELRIGVESDGIMEFADQIQVGVDVASLYADTIFEISLTPNLGHCASVLGVARELATITGLPLKKKLQPSEPTLNLFTDREVEVAIENGKGCPRYACRLIRDVTAAPSPSWLKKRLEDCGIRSINNLVDITNYLLLELGHPLHAFDFDKIEGAKIVVRSAQAGERLVTLDGRDRELAETDLLICDAHKPIALAGVMGGQQTEVGNNSRHILVEAGYFDPRQVRKAGKHHGLMTEASKRFERGTDPNVLIEVLDRATAMIQEIAGGTAGEVLDVKQHEFPQKLVNCRLERINGLLGTHLSVNEVENIFRRLHFTCHWNGLDTFAVHVPTYRADIHEEIDLIEEVARIFGYDNIPKQPPRYQASSIPNAPLYLLEKEVRTRLTAEGLQEFLTSDLIGPSLLQIVGEDLLPSDATVAVLNPTSLEQSLLRTSLLPGLLQVIAYNRDHQCSNIAGFEVGRVHFKEGEGYREQSVVGIILTGKRDPENGMKELLECDFYDMKGIIENFLAGWGVEGTKFVSNNQPIFHQGRRASLQVGELEIGSFGELHPALLRRLDVTKPIFFAEINLHDLQKIGKKEWKMSSLPLYPGSDRDWTVTLPEATPVQSVFDYFYAQPPKLLKKISLIGLYKSEKLGHDKKNVTFRFHYRADDRTMEQEEVDREHFDLVHAAESKLLILNGPLKS